jgi:hypothetical protein
MQLLVAPACTACRRICAHISPLLRQRTVLLRQRRHAARRAARTSDANPRVHGAAAARACTYLMSAWYSSFSRCVHASPSRGPARTWPAARQSAATRERHRACVRAHCQQRDLLHIRQRAVVPRLHRGGAAVRQRAPRSATRTRRRTRALAERQPTRSCGQSPASWLQPQQPQCHALLRGGLGQRVRVCWADLSPAASSASARSGAALPSTPQLFASCLRCAAAAAPALLSACCRRPCLRSRRSRLALSRQRQEGGAAPRCARTALRCGRRHQLQRVVCSRPGAERIARGCRLRSARRAAPTHAVPLRLRECAVRCRGCRPPTWDI